jgi:CRISPR/Cas system-associated exonuclease Cas4 (RecB family)
VCFAGNQPIVATNALGGELYMDSEPYLFKKGFELVESNRAKVDYISFVKKSRQQLMSRENGVSVKDLTFCPRRAVFSKVDPVPMMTDEEYYFYVSGQADHEVIQRHFMLYPERFRAELEVQYKQVRGRIDIYDKILNNVIDIKTSKSQKILLKPFKFHEKQVRYYMAMVGSDEGQIIYQMNHFHMYRSFPFFLNAEQRSRLLEEIESEANSLRKAIDARDPSLAKGIYDDKEINWMCTKCPYIEKCQSMRNMTEVGSAGRYIATSDEDIDKPP